jgi:hypothetical protein
MQQTPRGRRKRRWGFKAWSLLLGSFEFKKFKIWVWEVQA